MEEHRPKKLLDQVRSHDAICLKHYSYRASKEAAHLAGIVKPNQLGSGEACRNPPSML